MRISSYIISTQVSSDKYMLVHGYTGAIDIIDKNTFKALNALKDGINHNFSPEEWNLLHARGYITEKSLQEEQQYVIRLAQALHKRALLATPTYTFVVTYDCNFRCPYCFEKTPLGS